jgi:SAM-dependent methyltransferase
MSRRQFSPDDPERRQWQDPDQILTTIGLKPGMVFVDMGCGDGYFALPAARMVGPEGRVYANDIDDGAIERLRQRAAQEGLGNLAEVLEKTAGTIRERFRLKREIHTKTAHGRFSGFVLILMPVVMIGILLAMAPEYFLLLIRDKVGQYLLATAVAMQIIGIWVIKRIVNIRL